MKNKFLKTIGFTTLTMMMFIAASQISVYGQENEGKDVSSELSANSKNRIVGVWLTTVTPRNCQTGDQVAPSFQGLITFNRGGTVAEYGANPMAPFRSPGHGIWKLIGSHGRYSFAFSFFPLTPAGIPVGRLKVTASVRLSENDNETASSGSFELRDPNGNLIAAGCSSATGTRFE